LSVREAMGVPVASSFLSENGTDRMARGFEASLGEENVSGLQEAYAGLLRHGPFPEPFLRQQDAFSEAWHREYAFGVIREEIRATSRLLDLDRLEHLFFLASKACTTPLSMAGLAKEIGVSHTTVKAWLEHMEKAYLLFSVTPWFRGIRRALRKGTKWYALDWTYALDGAGRWENMVASALHRTCIVLHDLCMGNYQLHYLKTLDKRGVDFMVSQNGRPALVVVMGGQGNKVSNAIQRRRTWFPRERTLGVQISTTPGVLTKVSEDTWIIGMDRFLYLLL
jgi:predicted AAA+ superfamily ATPase